MRQRVLQDEGITLAQDATLETPVHRGTLTGRDRAILRQGVGSSPSLVQRPVHFDNFSATRYAFFTHFHFGLFAK